jgi:hypothetical protein
MSLSSEKNVGIIVGHWDVVDQLDLLQQTGVITFIHLNQQ